MLTRVKQGLLMMTRIRRRNACHWWWMAKGV